MSNTFWFRLLNYGHFCDSCKLKTFPLKENWYRLDIAADMIVKLLVLHQTFFVPVEVEPF